MRRGGKGLQFKTDATWRADFPARTTLSDKISRLHPRHVVPKPGQAHEPKGLVKLREGIAPAPIRLTLCLKRNHRLKVRRKLLTPNEAREGLGLLRSLVEPTPTAHMHLHEMALINHPTYDTLYLAFAIAMGASAVVSADTSFLQSVRTHSEKAVSAMALALEAWARSRSVQL